MGVIPVKVSNQMVSARNLPVPGNTRVQTLDLESSHLGIYPGLVGPRTAEVTDNVGDFS